MALGQFFGQLFEAIGINVVELWNVAIIHWNEGVLRWP
jgi:hypothetical protein